MYADQHSVSLDLYGSGTQQWQVKGKQGLIDFKNIVVSAFHEVLCDNVGFAGAGKEKPRLFQHLLCLLYRQLQCNGTSYS